MPRSTLIFGNGLGMALDHESFNLERALHLTWADNHILDENARSSIRACLPNPKENERPDREDDLDKLQQVLSACDFLNEIKIENQEHWLTQKGSEFPRAIRKFVHRVASKFVNNGNELPEKFSHPLSIFIQNTKSHIATLNYDDLLYEALLKKISFEDITDLCSTE